MSIKQIYYVSGPELNQSEVLLFSRPNNKDLVKKHHVYAKYYSKIKKTLKC